MLVDIKDYPRYLYDTERHLVYRKETGEVIQMLKTKKFNREYFRLFKDKLQKHRRVYLDDLIETNIQFPSKSK